LRVADVEGDDLVPLPLELVRAPRQAAANLITDVAEAVARANAGVGLHRVSCTSERKDTIRQLPEAVTGHVAGVRHCFPYRHPRRALLDRMRTPSAKHAPGGWCSLFLLQGLTDPRERQAAWLYIRVHDRHGIQQGSCVRMQRAHEERARVSKLHHTSAI